MALFQDLHSQGKTIAFVTHEPDIAALTTRIIRLRDGHIVEDKANTPLSALQMLQTL
jgi:putative ABC transport system ATP-binding protein